MTAIRTDVTALRTDVTILGDEFDALQLQVFAK